MRLLVLAAALVVSSVVPAGPIASQDTAFVKALRSHTSPFELSGGRMRGLGADALSRVAGESQFIMIGEDHGIREVPQFTAALWETARPHGYSHIAVEIGPVSGSNLERMMRRPGAQRDVEAFLTKYTSFALPFFFWKEESVMLEGIVKSLPAKRDIVWGIDQEFMLAPTYLFDRLIAVAPNASARTLATHEGLRDSRRRRKRDMERLSSPDSRNVCKRKAQAARSPGNQAAPVVRWRGHRTRGARIGVHQIVSSGS